MRSGFEDPACKRRIGWDSAMDKGGLPSDLEKGDVRENGRSLHVERKVC